MRYFFMVAFVAGVGLVGCSTKKNVADVEDNAPVLSIEEATRLVRANVVQITPLTENGLKGWYELVVLFPNGDKGVTYLSQDKTRLVVGNVFDVNAGKNLTAERIQALNPNGVAKSDKGRLSTKDIDELRKNKLVTMGNAKAKDRVLVVVDPMCPYCHKAWPQVEDLAKTKTVAIDVVPVGLLGQRSMDLASKMYSAKEKNRKVLLEKQMAGGDIDASKITNEGKGDAILVSVIAQSAAIPVPYFVLPNGTQIKGYRPALFSSLNGGSK